MQEVAVCPACRKDGGRDLRESIRPGGPDAAQLGIRLSGGIRDVPEGVPGAAVLPAGKRDVPAGPDPSEGNLSQLVYRLRGSNILFRFISRCTACWSRGRSYARMKPHARCSMKKGGLHKPHPTCGSICQTAAGCPQSSCMITSPAGRAPAPGIFWKGSMGFCNVTATRGITKSGDVILVCCLAHCRRKFYEAVPAGRQKRAKLLDILSERSDTGTKAADGKGNFPHGSRLKWGWPTATGCSISNAA